MAAKRFSASSASQLIACPGSADLEKSIPGWEASVVDDTKGAKGVGTKLHAWLAETSHFSASDLASLAKALEYMAQLRARRRFRVLAEQSVQAEWLVSKPGTTVDVVLYTQDELHIVDWKTGKIPVSPIRNEQLMFYAACFIHLAPRATEVRLHIIQPWSSQGSDEWVCSAQELAEFIHRAKQAELKVLNGDTTLNPSDHCTFCPANPHSRGDKGRPLCPAMMQKLYPITVDEDEILAL